MMHRVDHHKTCFYYCCRCQVAEKLAHVPTLAFGSIDIEKNELPADVVRHLRKKDGAVAHCPCPGVTTLQ